MTADPVTAPPLTIASHDLPRAWGGAAGQGVLRARPEDFQVDEVLGFAPAGEGEHLLLRIRKRNLTTREMARRVARACGAKLRDVGYCGMKDRVAVATQWFSAPLTARPESDWSGLDTPESDVLETVRHARKLRPGSHATNRFTLVLRDVTGPATVFEQRLRSIQRGGFPNYFGAQRFGNRGDNAVRAQAMLAGKLRVDRGERGIVLSALRSALFNHVLAARVTDRTWDAALADDVLMLAGTHSVFVAGTDADVKSRLAEGDVHVTGPLCGRARDRLGELREREQAILAPFADDLGALDRAGVRAQRRALRAMPRALDWHWDGARRLALAFTLEPGVFATSLTHELIDEK